MTSTAWVELPVGAIVMGRRKRPIEPAAVANLKVSISESGWFGSILVRPIPGEEGEQLYALVAGAHRLTAMRELGRSRIAATIRPLSDDEAEQIEIDENLVRRNLTPLERAEMVADRLQVWRRRFPERVADEDGAARPKRGRPGNSDKMSQFPGVPETMGFAEGTAQELGLNRKTVNRALAVASLPSDLRAQLRGTWIAKNEGALRQLAALGEPVEQAAVAQLLIEGKTKNVSDARAIAAGNTPSKARQTEPDQAVKAFRAVWKAATPSARAAILHELAGLKLPAGFTVVDERA